MDVIRYVWMYAGDYRYLLIFAWVVDILMIPIGIKLFKESKLIIVIDIIIIFAIETFYFWSYFSAKCF